MDGVEGVPNEPMAEGFQESDRNLEVQDPAPREKEPKEIAANFDSARCLKLIGLPTSLFEEICTAFSDTVVEILNKTFSIPVEAVEKVIRFPKPIPFDDSDVSF